MINYPIYVRVYSNDDTNATYVIQINNDSEYKMFLLLSDTVLDLFTWEKKKIQKFGQQMT